MVELGPTPSDEVLTRTALMSKHDLARKSGRRVFFSTGMMATGRLLQAAIDAGLRLAQATAAFELGCGGARLIRHLRSIKGLRLVGSDLIEENVQWCRQNIAGIEFHQNKLEPPLQFAADASFDYVFAYSVFTHIPMHLQLPWIEELSRILKPGGVATITVLGQEMAEMMMNDSELDELNAEGQYTMTPDHPRVSESSAQIGSWDVFMTRERVRELYGSAFEVVSQHAMPQSIVTLRKPVNA